MTGILYTDPIGSAHIKLGERPDASDTGFQTSLVREIAVRKSSLDVAGLAGWLPNPDPVLRKTGQSIDAYQELLSDPHVGGAVQSRKAATLKLEWMVNLEGVSDDPYAQLAAGVVEKLFRRLDVRRMITDILNAPLFGFQPLEVMWEFHSTYLLPKAVVAKPVRWFVFDTLGRLVFLGRENIDRQPVPHRKFLVAQHNPTYDNLYGEAVLSRCFWPVTFKRGGTKFWVTFIERYGMPWVLAYYPPGYDQPKVDKLVRDIDGMVQDAVVALPQGVTGSIVPPGGTQNSDLFQRLLDWCNAEISKALLGHTGSISSTPGKLGNEDAAITVMENIVQADKQLVEDAFNQLIDWIYELNFAAVPGERPRFTMYAEQDVDLDIANRDQVLSNMGVRFTPEYYQATYGLDKEHFTVTDPVGTPNVTAGLVGGLGTSGATKSFAANATLATDQQLVDALSAALADRQLQKQMEQVIPPVLDLIQRKAGNYEEAITGLAALFPELSTEELQDTMQTFTFLSELIGREAVLREEANGGGA